MSAPRSGWNALGSLASRAPLDAAALVDGLERLLDELGRPLDAANVLLCNGGGGAAVAELAARCSRLTVTEPVEALRTYLCDTWEAEARVTIDAAEAPTGEASYDVIVAFERALDHVDPQRWFEQAYQAIRPGGALVVELLSRELSARDFRSFRYEERAGYVIQVQTEITESWQALRERWKLLSDEGNRELTVERRVVGMREALDYAAGAGFDSVAALGGWGGERFGPHADALVVRCIRPRREIS